MLKWNSYPEYPGVRSLHLKDGDEVFYIRFKANGKSIQKRIGKKSEGVTAETAYQELLRFKEELRRKPKESSFSLFGQEERHFSLVPLTREALEKHGIPFSPWTLRSWRKKRKHSELFVKIGRRVFLVYEAWQKLVEQKLNDQAKEALSTPSPPQSS